MPTTDEYVDGLIAAAESAGLQVGPKNLICLSAEEFAFDPYRVQSLEGVTEDRRSRHGEQTLITFRDGSYKLLMTSFDDVVTALAEVFNRG